MQTMLKRGGWKADLPDFRDHEYLAPKIVLPQSADLRPGMPAVYDQGNLGSCTGNAIAGVLEYEAIKEQEKPFVPSRLFIYYQERRMEGSVASDAGASIRDGIKAVNSVGVPHETTWPYDESKFADKPSAAAYTEAGTFKSLTYARVTRQSSLTNFRAALATGTPVVFGFTAFPALESALVARTGILPLPSKSEAPIGGHAVVAVGYDDTTKRMIVRNSWSDSWGLSGYFYMPYAYFTDSGLSSDFWAITKVS